MAIVFRCTESEPVVKTQQGRVRGFYIDGVYTFHGIPYAQAQRFLPPQPVPAWDGIRDALNYGYVCPLLNQDTATQELLVPHRYWLMDEHCQNLNVWTKHIDPSAKAPVMVWFHGGAFTAGSAIEHICYEGDQLCAFADVVVVSVNHRLNVLGYLDLSEYDTMYSNSANAGNADLVAALQWIHDNIAAFGGDPENVTLFGQSGGGNKITCLMNTPAADGLFHKAIIESGCMEMHEAEGSARPLVDAMLKELGLTAAQIDQLSVISYPRLAEAYKKAVKEVAPTGVYIGSFPKPNHWYKGDPRKVGFTAHAKTIPVLIGTALGEFCFDPSVQGKYAMTQEEINKLLENKYGSFANVVAEEFTRAYPGKHLSDALYLDQIFRLPTRDFIHARMEQGCAPTWSYLFTYDFPIDGGKVAWHCSEIPFVFHNTHRAPLYNVPGETDRLEKAICTAWSNFAKSGIPYAPEFPSWDASRDGEERTMIVDINSRMAVEHDRRLQEVLQCSNTAIALRLSDCILPFAADLNIVH